MKIISKIYKYIVANLSCFFFRRKTYFCHNIAVHLSRFLRGNRSFQANSNGSYRIFALTCTAQYRRKIAAECVRMVIIRTG